MNSTTSATAWLRARQLLQDGRTQEAVDVARAGLAILPDDGRLMQVLGLAWFGEGRIDAARNALETSLFLTPLSTEALLALAEIYTATKRTKDAHVSLSLLSERVDFDAKLLPRVASLFGRIGDARAALKLCRRAIEADPDCDEAMFGASFYMRRLGFPGEMIAALLRRALRLDPECCLYRQTLAGLLASRGEWNEACDLYRSISPEQVCCTNCLRLMTEVFDRAGEDDRRNACQVRLHQLAEIRRDAASASPKPFSDNNE